MPTDDELVAATLGGDPGAFDALVVRYERYVRAAAINVLGAGADGVDDATQDAFLRAYLNLASYRPGGRFRFWLARIVANRCCDLRRGRRETVALDLLPGRADPAPGPDDVALAHELGAALAGALAAIPRDQAVAVVLCDGQGLTMRAASARLAVNPGTLKTRLGRGRRRLRRLLAPECAHLASQGGTP